MPLPQEMGIGILCHLRPVPAMHRRRNLQTLKYMVRRRMPTSGSIRCINTVLGQATPGGLADAEPSHQRPIPIRREYSWSRIGECKSHTTIPLAMADNLGRVGEDMTIYLRCTQIAPALPILSSKCVRVVAQRIRPATLHTMKWREADGNRLSAAIS